MKLRVSALSWLLVVADSGMPVAGATLQAGSASAQEEPRTFSSLDRPGAGAQQERLPAGTLRLQQAELPQVLKIYQELSHRTVIHSPALPAVQLTVESATPLTRSEILQLLDTALAQQGVAMVALGTKFVKAVPAGQAITEPGPVMDCPPEELPESSSFVIYILDSGQLMMPSRLAQRLAPLAKLPSSIVAMDSEGILMLKDYSANVRRMLLLIEKIKASTPVDDPKNAPRRR